MSKKMGAKLAEFYQTAAGIGGFKAQMRLAMLTLVPSSKAATAADSPENIRKFTNAINEIKKEFAKKSGK